MQGITKRADDRYALNMDDPERLLGGACVDGIKVGQVTDAGANHLEEERAGEKRDQT